MKKIIALFILLIISNAYSLTIDLSANPLIAEAGETIEFTGIVSNGTGPYVFEWDFDGDGTIDKRTTINDPETTSNEFYDYINAGQFNAKLTVTDASETRNAVKTIKVYNLTLSTTTNPDPAEGTAPLPVIFNATAINGSAPYVFEVDFDGDGTIDTTLNSPDSITVNHTYSNPGVFNAKIKVTDTRMKEKETIKEITVHSPGANVLPVADPSGPYSGEPGIPFTLDASASYDPDGIITHYHWVIPGAGTCHPFSSTKKNPEIVCINPVNTVIYLIVRDNRGGRAFALTQLNVQPVYRENKVDIAKIKVEPEIIKTGDNLTVIVKARNMTNVPQTFDLKYYIKENVSDKNISALPELISDSINSLTINTAYGQKDFSFTISSADLQANLKTQKNYWVYATAVSSGEANTLLNTRRTIFNYFGVKELQIPETNLIGIMVILISVLMIFEFSRKKNKKDRLLN